MSKIINIWHGRAAALPTKIRAAVSNQRADFYISDAVKVIIAVVLGGLLLAAITLIFNGTVIPKITQAIQALFA